MNYKFKSNGKRDAKKSEWVKMRFDLVKGIFGVEGKKKKNIIKKKSIEERQLENKETHKFILKNMIILGEIE